MAPSDKKFISFEHQGDRWYVPHADIAADHKAAFERLRSQGFPIPGVAFVARLIEQIQDVADFPATEIAEACGWFEGAFVKPDGRLIVPPKVELDDCPKTGIGFFRHKGRYSCEGSFKVWREEVAKPLALSDYAMVAMAVCFAPAVRTLLSTPILPFGVEFVSERDSGKLRQLLISTTGSARGGRFTAEPVLDLAGYPAHYIEGSRDHLLVPGDVDGYLRGATGKKRSDAVRALVFDHLLASGNDETNGSGGSAPMFALVEPQSIIASLRLNQGDVSRVSGRLITIQIPSEEFGSANDGDGASHGIVWSSIAAASMDHHGVALDTFLQRLVERRSGGVGKLREMLDDAFVKFSRKARAKAKKRGGNPDLADPFALIYASLVLAQDLRVLPKGDNPIGRVGRIYEAVLGEAPKHPTVAARLREIAAMEGVLNLDDVGSDWTKKKILTVRAYIKHAKGGQRQLWVTTHQKENVLDWPALKKLGDFDKWFIKGEGDRNGAKRTIGKCPGIRVIRFRMPT